MCECGCTMNNEYYLLPAPRGEVYLITFSRPCVDCDAPAGISIERFKSKSIIEHYMGELPPELPMEKWPESFGVCIATGYLRHEFVKAMKGNLIGLKSDDYADKPGDGLDKIAAETILEDMYDDSTFTPTLVQPVKKK